ncbi:MAG: hypothetical protein P0Y48_14020 [Candidatus Microbacterium phytovorans]|uniref:Uncharacterized protein n=1 Tax=Candidatus Microbacterium phytovorans TaxID=3121374 RepID=A0AAJ5W0Z2_9MICO|nr:hypothetical protein [Microbacterium sp.]WEK13555.1 MAG: hypothetical protein P0Y48_14020 [Microbacterium sp.]
MNSLREELGGEPVTAATPYTLLCPPGWRRIPAAALADDVTVAPVVAQLKASGRPDLVLAFRAMLVRYRGAVRESGAFRAYLAPLADGIPLPAVMLVSPFVLPDTTTWEMALARLARGSAVGDADFTETPMWVWRGSGRTGDDGAVLAGRSSHYLVPTAEPGARRALYFHFTALAADDPQTLALAETLVRVGDLMMGTMRWVHAGAR